MKTDAPQEVGSGISRRKLSFSGNGKVQHEVHEKQRKREFERIPLMALKKDTAWFFKITYLTSIGFYVYCPSILVHQLQDI